MTETTKPTEATAPAADDARVAELEAEIARLRDQLAAAAGQAAPGRAGPSFVFNEAMRDELERTGRTVSPTGKRYVGSGVADAREATPAEFDKAKPPVRPKAGGAGGSSSATSATARGGRSGGRAK